LSAVAWRIAVEAPGYAANDLSGAGAMRSGGRWNSPNQPMVYASSSIALAVLETLSYIGKDALPFDRFLVRIDIPDDVWDRRTAPKFLPAGWDAIPAGLTSRRYGDKWRKSERSVLLVVPSVIIPDEQNILINPVHPEAARISATTVKRWVFDPRFF
jgi:RES domain-containing protein